MKKKVLSLLIGVVLTVSSLAGCGNTTDPAAKEDNKAEVSTQATVSKEETKEEVSAEPIALKWAIWDKESTSYWQELVDQYALIHPNITIEMIDLGSSDYMTVLATELSGEGSELDVVTIKDVPGYATLVQKNAILSLDSYIVDAGIDLTKYAGTTDQITVDGSLYQLPFRSDFWLLFYNKDVFDAAEEAYPTNDMAFDEIGRASWRERV